MDKLLTRLINNKRLFSKVIFVLGELGFSILCLFIVKKTWVAILYLIITAGLSVVAKVYSDNELAKIVGFLAKIDKKIIYFIFFIIALSPEIVGYAKGEIFFGGLEDFIKKMFYNPIQNCLGVLIVCSAMGYLSQFNTEQTISSVIQSRKVFFDIIMYFSFMGTSLCALMYKVDEKLYWVNTLNSIHLFVIIFSGALVLSVFALRIIDKQPFQFSAKQIYPTKTLLFATLFLLSCNLPPIIWRETKHEVLLLALNTSVALIVIWFLFFIIKYKAAENTDEYPYTAPVLFSGCMISNLFFGIFSVENEVNKEAQFLSGICIFLFVILIINYINQQRKNDINIDIEDKDMEDD